MLRLGTKQCHPKDRWREWLGQRAGAKVLRGQLWSTVKLRVGQSSQSWCLRLQSWAGGLEAEGLGFCHRMMGSHGCCVSRDAAESDWEGSGQGLGLTWAPLLAATPRSGTNSSRPPAIPAAPWKCCPSCGLWPPWGQKETVSEVGETKAGQGSSPAPWLCT